MKNQPHSEMNRFVNEQNRMGIGSDEYIAHAKKIRELREYLKEHARNIGSAASAWSEIYNKFLQFGTGIAEYETGSSNLRIWPNPANNILHVESANEPIDHVCILDLNGKTLIRQSLKNVNPIVNITDLPAGIYIVKTICDDRIAVGKFVKTN